MKELTLKDLTPQPGMFSLASTGKDYHLRPVSLLDESWIQAHFAHKTAEQMQNLNVYEVCEIAFHQMEEQDKVDFKKQKVTVMDENGDTEEMELGGVKLFFFMIRGKSEQKSIAEAACLTMGVSRPILDQIEKESQKKNQVTETQRSSGQKSSTHYLRNTAGRRNTSGRAR